MVQPYKERVPFKELEADWLKRPYKGAVQGPIGENDDGYTEWDKERNPGVDALNAADAPENLANAVYPP